MFFHFRRVVGRTKSFKVGRRHASIIYLFTFKFKFRESAWAVEIFSPHQRLTINYKDNTNISILTHPKSKIHIFIFITRCPKKADIYNHSSNNCEAQGKGRAKGRPRKVTQRSFIDGGWWMVDILSLMLYTKVGCHPPPPPPPTHKFNLTQLMARWGPGGLGGGNVKCVGSLWVTLGSL